MERLAAQWREVAAVTEDRAPRLQAALCQQKAHVWRMAAQMIDERERVDDE